MRAARQTLAALVFAFAALVTAAASAQTPQSLPTSPAQLVTATGTHDLTVEMADDPIERATGLMWRESMPDDRGMLFDFGNEGERSFWMRNTILSLDIIYIRADGSVLSIAKGTEPFSLAAIPSNGPARFVLEVNAGVADALSLAPGDRLIHARIP
ncbi:MAG: DUF192 domain-containing protein [Pseudomonadota bacterium]